VGEGVTVLVGVLVAVTVIVGVFDGVTVFVGVLVGVGAIQLLISQPKSSIIETQYEVSDNTDGNSKENGRLES